MMNSDSYRNPAPGMTYISPALKDFRSEQVVRIASKAVQSSVDFSFAKVKGEVILRCKPGSKTQVKARFFEVDRGIAVLSFQTYDNDTQFPIGKSFSFIGSEISKLIEFVAAIRSVELRGTASHVVPDDIVSQMALSAHQVKRILRENEDLAVEMMRSQITKRDVVTLGYRKQQLERFGRLLNDPAFYAEAREEKSGRGEAVWQEFFENNPWIFGYGLSYIYLDSVEERLEQVVHGYRVGESGKRVDALLKTRGFVSSLCFVEIKTHQSELLVKGKAYREGCWPPSSELAGAVAQVQGTVSAAIESIRTKLHLKDEDGFPTGEALFNFAPKSYLVVGSLGEFVKEGQVHHERFRSFELFRRNLSSPEVITFDELYERAKFIVASDSSTPIEHSEGGEAILGVEESWN